MSVASSSGCSSLIGYDNNNEINRGIKMKKQQSNNITSPLTSIGSATGTTPQGVPDNSAIVVGGVGNNVHAGNGAGGTKPLLSHQHTTRVTHQHHHQHLRHQPSQPHGPETEDEESGTSGGNHAASSHLIGNDYASSSSPSSWGWCNRSHLNSLWSVWYGFFGTLLQAYAAVKCARRFLQYAVLPWNEENAPPPVHEFHASLLLTGVAVLLLPLFLVSAVFKVGNNANDGVKLGRGLSTCSRDPASSLLGAGVGGRGGCSGLWRHGGPTAPFLHMITAICLLLPKLLMEARLIEAGFLPQEAIWKTDLDFMVVHRDRLVVLSFMTSPSVNLSGPSATPIGTTTASPFNYSMSWNNYSGLVEEPQHQPFSMVQTLKNILGADNIEVDPTGPDAGWSSISVEYMNYAAALLVYSVRYPSVFWSTNKFFGSLFSIQLLANGLQSLLAYAGMSVLYKVQMIGPAKVLPLLKHHSQLGSQSSAVFAAESAKNSILSLLGASTNGPAKNSPFLLNPEVTLGLFILSSLLILASSLVLYLYGYGRFHAFINHERTRKIIVMKNSNQTGWGYVTHCAALCVVLSVGVCNAPLFHDYMVVYRGSLDGTILTCIIGGISHLFLWIVLWLFLTIKQKWIFKLRVTVGRATVRSARSVKLVTDVDLIASHKKNRKPNKDDASSLCGQPLLVVGNGRTYTIQDTSPKKAIMSVIQKAAMDRKARSGQKDLDDAEGEEQIYWLRPTITSPPRSPDSEKLNWFNKRLANGVKHKVTFNDIPSTSSSRNKAGFAKARRPGCGMDEDDGDYATLRELPIASAIADTGDDSTSEEGKLLACMQDESVTYASTSRDLIPPGDYEDPSPLLTPELLSDRDEPDGMAATALASTTNQTNQINVPVPPTNSNAQSVTNSQSSGSTPRCLRRGDSGMPHEELTPRSDSLSNSESSTSPPEIPGSNHSESSSGIHSNTSSERPTAKIITNGCSDLGQIESKVPIQTQWQNSPLQNLTPTLTVNPIPNTIYGFTKAVHSPIYVSSTNTSINGDIPEEHSGVPAMVLENPVENTVVIRRKPNRPISNDPTVMNGIIVKDEPFGRSTNMRMTSFTDDLRNTQASSATLPHYPTQPLQQPVAYPHCSTMPLPQHNNPLAGSNLPQQMTGTSCNPFPRPHHTTIPTQLNGVRLFTGTPNPYLLKRFPTYLHQNGALHARINAAEAIYGTNGTTTRISGEIYHYNS